MKEYSLEEAQYELAKASLTTQRAIYRLSDLLAHEFTIEGVFPKQYVILRRGHEQLLILPNGDFYSRCLG